MKFKKINSKDQNSLPPLDVQVLLKLKDSAGIFYDIDVLQKIVIEKDTLSWEFERVIDNQVVGWCEITDDDDPV